MSQMQMLEAGVQVEAGLELRELVRPLFMRVVRGVRGLYARAHTPAARQQDPSVARSGVERRVASAHEGG